MDTTGPSVQHLTSTNGIYKEGQSVLISVKFNEVVTAAGTSDLKLKLETGNVDREANYLSGSGSDTLVFEYVPQLGDVASNLNYSDTSSLILGMTGLIKDSLNNAASVTLPAIGHANSLAVRSQVVIDTTPPSSPTAITLPGNHSTTTSISVSFTPSVDANFKEHRAKLCSANDCSTSCTAEVISILSPVNITAADNSTFFACVRGVDTVGHLTAWSVSADSITIDASAPTVSRVSSTTPNGVYKVGDILSLTVEFSESVSVSPGSDIKLQLETGTTDHLAAYVSGTGSNILAFTYTVQASDATDVLNYLNPSALNIISGTIRDAAGNNAVLTLPALDSTESLALQKSLSLDTTPPTAPTAVGFDSPLSNTETFDVNFGVSTDAHLDTHNVKLCSDSACSAGCTAETQSSFSPATQTGVNGQSYYACVQGVDTLGHETAWVASATQVTIDTTLATITNVTSAANDNTYTTNAQIDITVTFDEAVTVSGGAGAKILLNTTPSAAQAVYESGSGSTTLIFRYNVQAGENSSDLQYATTSALTLTAGATIKDAAGNDATITLPALAGASLGAQKAIVIDTLAPTNPTAVGFGSPISNTDALSLSWGNSTDDNFLTHHTKLCESNDCSTDCLAAEDSIASPITLNGSNNKSYFGCVQAEDRAGLTSDWVSSLDAISIDSTPPSVLEVNSSSDDDSYKMGAVIALSVKFSEAVYLTNENALTLLLETGTPDRAATYVSGHGTDTLNFSYTVQAGDTSDDLNYASTSALDLNASATVSDAAGSAANLTLPNLTTGSSLAVNKAIIIDTAAPLAPVIVTPVDDSTVPTAVSVVSGTSEANARIELKNDTTVIGTTTAVGTDWSITLAAPYTDGTYAITAEASDAAGNVSPVTAETNFVVDTIVPSTPIIAAFTSPTTTTMHSFSGTAEPNMLVKIYKDGVHLVDATADGSGDWTSAPIAITDGNYSITATAVDNLARASTPTAGATLNIDTSNPPPPVSASFAGPTSTTATFPIDWVASATLDPNHQRYNAKLCDTTTCDGTCISLTHSAASPTDLLGEDNGTYYGCVQAQDSLGHVSAWVSTPATILVDTVGATIQSVTSSTANGVYTTGATVSIQVEFSEIVNVVGTDLTLKLETGTTDNVATYVNGSGSDTLNFTYTVQATDNSNDLNYFNTAALTLGTSTIQDLGSNNAILTLPPLASGNSLAGSKAIRLDTTAPTAPSNVGFSSATVNNTSFDMTWTAGSDANFHRYNTKICTNIDCNTGCVSSSTSTSLTDSMTGSAGTTYYGCVQTSDHVGLTSAFIVSTQTVTVDTTVPTVSGVSSSKADGSYKVGEMIPIEVTFTEPVYVLVPGDVKLKLETGASDRVLSYTSGTGTNTLVFNYTVQTSDTSADLNVFDANSLTVTPGGSIRDVAGNNATRTLATAGAGSLTLSKNLIIDTSAPLAPAITTPANNTYSITDVNSIVGTSESNATIIVKNGTTTLGTVSAVGTDWTLNLVPSLSDGVYSLTATATDAAGNISSASSTFTLTVDTSAPNVPVVNAMTSPSTDTTPTVSGTSEAGMSIKVYADGVEVATATANGSGNWTTTSSALTDGVKSITATATDLGPRTSAASAAVSYTVDTTNPSNPAAVAFASPYSTSTTVALTWTTSTDTNFLRHQVKQCSDSGCTTCGASTNVTGNSTDLTVAAGTTTWACVRGQDAVNNYSAWVASATSVTVDQTVPSVVSVTTAKANGAYKVGEVIDVNVNFSETLAITDPNLLELVMDTGVTKTPATYVSGDGASTIVFRYTVAASNVSPDLDYYLASALSLNGAVIKDLAGNTANKTLATPGTAGSISSAKTIVIDTTAPTVPTAVSFPVSITNSTSLALNWSAASDTNLSRYNTQLCSNTGCSADCIDLANTTSLNQSKIGSAGSTYYGCVQAQDSAGNLSAFVASASSIQIDQAAPTITSVSSTKANGSYKAGVSIPVTVTFNKPVTVTGSGVALLLETGTPDQNVALTSGSGTATLTFDYIVQSGDVSADLNYVDASALTLGAATIKDSANNNAVLTLPWPTTNTLATNKALVIDTTAPAAPTIDSPSANYSMTNITTVVGESEANATITIKDGATTVGTATADGNGDWTSTLSTTLTDGAHILTAIATDLAGNVSTASATRNVQVDTTGPNAPTLNAFTAVTNNTTPTFTGTSEANMSITVFQGATAIATTTADGAGNWSATAAPALAEGVYTITAKATDPGPRTSSASASRSLTIDTTVPTLTPGLDVYSDQGHGTRKIGDVLNIFAYFTEPVYVTGTPTFTFETGASDAVVNYSSGSGSRYIYFNYTVAEGHTSNHLDYVSNSALSGTLKDLAGNTAILTLAEPGATGSLAENRTHVIDGIRPTVTSVSASNSNGSYGEGNAIDITLTFSENIAFTGNPTLALNTTPARNATFVSSAGAVATFRYTVLANDSSADLNYTTTSALALTGGTIRDVAGNDANLTLPATGGASSLGTQKNIVIVGGSAPPVLSATPSAGEAYVGSQIVVEANNNTGNDLTNDGRAITYTCIYDNSLNQNVSVAQVCTDLAGLTFDSATGTITWTPTSAANASYTAYTEYEFRIMGSTNANTSSKVYPSMKVIRPWTKTIAYNAADSAQYSFNVSEVNFSGGKVALKALDQDNDATDIGWENVATQGAQYGSGDGFARLANSGSCDGLSYNCYYVNSDWVPAVTNRVFSSAGSSIADFLYNADPAKQPTSNSTFKRSGGKSIYFGGTDYLYLNRIVEDSFAVGLWFKTTSTYASGGCVKFNDGMGIVFADAPGTVNDWGLSMCDGFVFANSGVGGAENGVTSTSRYNDGKWHHMYFARNMTNGAFTFLIDNISIGNWTAGAGVKLNAPSAIYFGSRTASAGFYTGNIDEVIIYDKALSANELGELYDRGVSHKSGFMTSRVFDGQANSTTWNNFSWKTTIPMGKELPDGVSETTAQYPQIVPNLMNNIRGIWHMNESSANTVSGADFKDSSGNDFHANSQGAGGQISYGLRGRFGKAAKFNGAAEVNIGNAFEFGTGNFTISMWFKTHKLTTNNNYQILATNRYGATEAGYTLSIWQDTMNFGLCKAGGSLATCMLIDANVGVSDGEWHHVTAVRSGTTARIYIDGVLAPITKAPTSCGTVAANVMDFAGCTNLTANRTSAASFLGGRNNGATRADNFEGVMDEVAGWSRAITAAEAMQLYRRGANRISTWMRTCTTADCSDNPSWKGPTGAATTFLGFSELNNNTAPLAVNGTVNTTAPSISTSDFGSTAWGSNRYFQYLMRFESDDDSSTCTYSGSPSLCSPELLSVAVGPDHYPLNSKVIWNTAQPFYNITSMVESLGAETCPSGVSYKFSNDNTNWKYSPSAGNWSAASSAIDTNMNSWSYLNSTALKNFGAQMGRDSFYVMTVLRSNSLTPCDLNSIMFGGNTTYD